MHFCSTNKVPNLIDGARCVSAELELLVGAVAAVVVRITLPLLRYASAIGNPEDTDQKRRKRRHSSPVVIALEFLRRADRLLAILAVLRILVRVVAAVVVAVAAVLRRDALLRVLASDRILRAIHLKVRCSV